MTAPAVTAGLSSMLTAMPTRPMPIVAATVQELPMLKATMPQISAVVM